jgi:hypothetical protein
MLKKTKKKKKKRRSIKVLKHHREDDRGQSVCLHRCVACSQEFLFCSLI